MEKLFNVPVELFQLEKLMLSRNKTCKVWYKIIDERGDKIIEYTGFVEPNYECIEEMQLKIDELKPYLLKLRHGKSNDVSIKGVVWKGVEEKESFKIFGTEISDTSKSMNLNSAVELFSEVEFSHEIRDILMELSYFAHAYIFELQKSQITMGLTPIEDDDFDTVENDFEKGNPE